MTGRVQPVNYGNMIVNSYASSGNKTNTIRYSRDRGTTWGSCLTSTTSFYSGLRNLGNSSALFWGDGALYVLDFANGLPACSASDYETITYPNGQAVRQRKASAMCVAESSNPVATNTPSTSPTVSSTPSVSSTPQVTTTKPSSSFSPTASSTPKVTTRSPSSSAPSPLCSNYLVALILILVATVLSLL